MLMPAVANGVANAANTPVMFSVKGPRPASADHGASAFTSEGTLATSQTTDSSVGVRVTEKKVPFTTQGGSESPGDMRHIAYEPATGSRVRLGAGSVAFLLWNRGLRAAREIYRQRFVGEHPRPPTFVPRYLLGGRHRMLQLLPQ